MKKGKEFFLQFTVTQNIYEGFIGISGDTNPLHTNDDFAKSKGFEKRVMHGNILNGFISYFIGEGLPIKNVIIQKQEIKYILPVYLGDSLHFHAEIADIFESVNTIEFDYYFKRDDKKVAKGTIQIGILP